MQCNWFVNVGASNENGDTRSWSDNRKFGFMSAGGGPRFAKMMKNIIVGEHVYAYLNEHGYVGLGEVTSAAVPIAQFHCADGSSTESSSAGRGADS